MPQHPDRAQACFLFNPQYLQSKEAGNPMVSQSDTEETNFFDQVLNIKVVALLLCCRVKTKPTMKLSCYIFHAILLSYLFVSMHMDKRYYKYVSSICQTESLV